MIIRLSADWLKEFEVFLRDLRENGDLDFFKPHSFDREDVEQLVNYLGKDLYYIQVENKKIYGYGLLRGWDEGYKVPSLGIAIHPALRGQGLGKQLMFFLHKAAIAQGADKVRLRVKKNNVKAINFYKSFGYEFDEDGSEYLVGIKFVK